MGSIFRDPIERRYGIGILIVLAALVAWDAYHGQLADPGYPTHEPVTDSTPADSLLPVDTLPE